MATNSLIQKYKIQAATYLKCYSEKKRDRSYSFAKENTYDPGVLNHVNALQTKGYSLIENFYTPSICNDIIGNIDNYMNQHPDLIDKSDGENDKKIWGSEKTTPLIQNYYQDRFLYSIAECYLKYPVKNYMTLAGCYELGKQYSTKGAEWHRDTEYEKQIKAILYLSDVTEENGPYGYVANSHRIKSVVETAGLFEKKTDYTEDKLDAYINTHKPLSKISLLGKAGTLILTDTMGIHRRSPIRTGKRYILTNYYVGAHRYADFDAIFSPLVVKNK